MKNVEADIVHWCDHHGVEHRKGNVKVVDFCEECNSGPPMGKINEANLPVDVIMWA